MKTMYCCEMCGKQFESYDECRQHENAALKIDLEYPAYRKELERFIDLGTFECNQFPRTLALQANTCGDIGRTRFAIYKFERELDEQDSMEIIETGNVRIKREDEAMKAYYAQKEAEKK